MAALQGCVFFGDSGEGRDMLTDTLYCEDISGWLVPYEKEAVFADVKRDGHPGVEWDGCFCFAEWEEKGGEVRVMFNKYPIYYDAKTLENTLKNHTDIMKPHLPNRNLQPA